MLHICVVQIYGYIPWSWHTFASGLLSSETVVLRLLSAE